MQLKLNGFDHVALTVSDVARSIRFYQEVLGLEQIERPAFPFPGAWFGLGNGHALHLIGKDVAANDSSHHFAMRIDDLDQWLQHLQNQDVDVRGPNPRPDGIQQLFFKDPDNNVIELDYDERNG